MAYENEVPARLTIAQTAALRAGQAEALDAADRATAAAGQAETYAETAASGAKYFDTIALGRAGVPDGHTFGVKAGGSDNLARSTTFRRDSASTQTKIAEMIAAEEVEDIATKAASATRSAGLIPIDYGAIGDGDAVDSTAVRSWAQSEPGAYGYKMAHAISGISPYAHLDFRRATLTKDVSGALNLVNASNLTGSSFENGVVDMNRRNLGNVTGHGMSLSGHDITIRDMTFRDFGSDGVGGGAGLNVSTPTADTHSRRMRLFDSAFYADPTAPLSFGYVLSNTECGIISRIYVEGVVGGNAYAHELKNDAIYNSMSQLVAKGSSVAVAFGQQTEGIDGADYNVVTNFVGAKTDQGILVGEGVGNVFVGGVHDAQGSPTSSSRRGVQLIGQASKNLVCGVSIFGDLQRTVAIEGDSNAVEVASYDTSATMVLLSAGSKRNVISFAHTGDRTSIIPYITDNSGSGITGADANVFTSESTRERIGSRSGYFHDRLGVSGAAFVGGQKWRYEDSTSVSLAIGTPDANNTLMAFAHNIPSKTRVAQLSSVIATAGNYWQFRVSEADVFRVYADRLHPVTAGYNMGRSANRFGTGWFDTVDVGNGATGTFTSQDGKTVTVTAGIITAIT